MAAYASAGGMKASKGDAVEHPVTEIEAPRSILVQGLPLLGQELTESSLVQVFSAYGNISKFLLQTHEDGKTQRAVIVYMESEAANAALQADGRDVLGSNCTVTLASSIPLMNDGSLTPENVSDQKGASTGDPTARVTTTTAEWIKNTFAQGVVYTRLFDEKLGVSDTAKGWAAKARDMDQKHNLSGRIADAATTATTKAREVDTRFSVSQTAQKWAKATKESADKALEDNPRVAARVQQTGTAITGVVKRFSEIAQEAIESAKQAAAPESSSAAAQSVRPETADEFSTPKTV